MMPVSKIIFHVDVNSAYLSWTAVERLKNGNSDTLDIRTIPAIIGGDISVSSEVGKGSIFTVKLKKKQEPSNRVLS